LKNEAKTSPSKIPEAVIEKLEPQEGLKYNELHSIPVKPLPERACSNVAGFSLIFATEFPGNL
jgi:hypothetical protein